MSFKVVDADSLRRYKKEFNFFETPPIIAKQMAEMIDSLGRDARILEPSAGLGALITAVQQACVIQPRIDFCEIQEEFIHQLYGHHVGMDFMDYHPGPIYDAVIMNPPYKNRLAEKHTSHAWDCIKPGGWIVSLVDTTAAEQIDQEFEGHIFHREEIKKGFKETGITVVLFQINKPLA